MKSLASVLLLLTTAANAAADSGDAGVYVPLALSSAAASADVALMRRALETIHPGLYRYAARRAIDAAFNRLQSAAAQPTTDLKLWQEIALMLAQIHCDHTKAEPSDPIDRYRDTHATHLPLRFMLIEGRMIVVSNDGQAQAPPPGAEIVAINEIPVPVALSALGSAVAYDGSTDQAIAAKLQSDGDLKGDDFNEYWPAWYGFPSQWTLEWRNRGASRLSTSTLTPIGFKAWTELRWPGGPYRDEFYRALRWRIAGSTAYLRIDTFVNYRNPVDATLFLGGFFKTLKGARVDHLILDLRQNGGGSEDVSVALGRYLLAERFIWSKPQLLKAIRYEDLPQYLESWGDRQQLFEPPLEVFRRTNDGWWEKRPREGDEDDASFFPQEISPDRFHGRLSLLTGPANGSGATRTVAQLRERTSARLIGEETSGSAEGPTAGHIFLLTLPNSGIKVRIPNAWNRTNIASFVPGRGVNVDQLVTPTLADFELGRDRAMEVAKTDVRLAPVTLGALFAGDWTGTLDYRDFQSDRRVILPCKASARSSGDGVRLHFIFDDGPGKVVQSDESWRISDDGKTLQVGESEGEGQGKRRGAAREAMMITEQSAGPATDDITLVAEGAGVENGVAVKVRTIVTRRGAALSITRLTRVPGAPFILRHAYRMQ